MTLSFGAALIITGRPGVMKGGNGSMFRYGKAVRRASGFVLVA